VLAAGGDSASARIITDAADALAALAGAVATRLQLSGPVVLAGGLAVHQPALQEQVRRRLAELGIPDVRVLADDPVLGAVRLAHRLFDAPPVDAGPTSPHRLGGES
jgi:N-acetylglucosamine kinase-like BadF-type ATPase